MNLIGTGQEAARVDLSQDQALVVLGLSGLSSDGHVAHEEVLGLISALAPLGIGADDEARDALVHECARLSDEHGLGPLTAAALATIAGDHREHALRLAFAVLMADGDIPDEELQFIGELQKALEISDERYEALLAEA